MIGRISAGRQDLISLVGIGSREQEASDEEEIALVISLTVAGKKRLSCGGTYGGGESVKCELEILGVNFEVILAIFSMKKVEKAVDIKRGDKKVGRTDGCFLESRESRPDHNFLGLYLF